jgi:H+-translocating NAD(P) transhydrogenase subunit alpha
MPLNIGVLRESMAEEARVALTPEVAARLAGLGASIHMQAGAGARSHLADTDFEHVQLHDDADAVLSASDVLLKVQPPTPDEVARMREGCVVIGFMQAHNNPDLVRELAERRITSFAMEFVPRISRAQSMDALSSQASIAGYKAALIAADSLDKFFPMLTTAAGTIRPSQVLIVGTGVAGLQAIATARRLGAVVEAYDVRTATREQVESLGARFVDTGVSAEGEGGYARELTDEEKARQQEVLDQHIARADAVITTAAIPGRKAPRIISAEAVARMQPGSVIVDLAAESGGNCELTQAGRTVVSANGVRVIGPSNLPSTLARHASQMYSRNILNFLTPAIRDGELAIDFDDEVYAASTLTRDGRIVHQGIAALVDGTDRQAAPAEPRP